MEQLRENGLLFRVTDRQKLYAFFANGQPFSTGLMQQVLYHTRAFGLLCLLVSPDYGMLL
jgi:hypothetical protein